MSSRVLPVVAILAGLALVVLVVLLLRRENPAGVSDQPIAVAADTIDPTNEGRLISVAGTLRADSQVVDTQLGVAVEAIALLRDVQMYQWQESCVAEACVQAPKWSADVIDVTAFREHNAHENPGDFPFASARFEADPIRLGAFVVDPALVVATIAARDKPVGLRDIHPNLEASFREQDGALYSEAEAHTPAIGDLRVSYRVVPAEDVILVGIQIGDQLLAPPAFNSN